MTAFAPPKDQETWQEWIRYYNLDGESLHTFRPLQSASKATVAQFLLCRILHDPKPAAEFRRDIELWGLTEHMTRARQLLTVDYSEFDNYLTSISQDSGVTYKGADDTLPLGIFELPRECQRHIHDYGHGYTPRVTSHLHTESVVPDADEESVNIALVNLLQAICLKVPGVMSRWVSTRLRLKADFRDNNSFLALVDGALSIWGEPEKLYALIECKARELGIGLTKVLVQQALEIVAWLMQKTRPACALPGRILLVSQDRHEIFLTVGTLDRHYLSFLQGKPAPERFLKLTVYGPWDTKVALQMAYLAEVILAFTLRVGTGET
ncbi:hypothetical protein BDV25DRAFT_138079 [Aspergillus avenaceus]|uniref:Uncharacterized protein n=1 Tax=Aspergillus avenaceus TaxID=36643 RepID=A0A5N6U121_ASPAV|nr:hypothetical protein BDV25DRAFT_138079 [Aspergillus avenaceus]